MLFCMYENIIVFIHRGTSDMLKCTIASPAVPVSASLLKNAVCWTNLCAQRYHLTHTLALIPMQLGHF